jgi:hypothetical protein
LLEFTGVMAEFAKWSSNTDAAPLEEEQEGDDGMKIRARA